MTPEQQALDRIERVQDGLFAFDPARTNLSTEHQLLQEAADLLRFGVGDDET